MAGGSGERFWPLSTKENPKQLLSLASNKSMIRETVERILNLVDYDDIYIATNAIQAVGIKKQIPELREENIIIEPAFRDTAAAIAYGSTYISKYENNPTITVLAADHLIEDVDGFIESLKLAKEEAERGSIVTLGVKPTKPETGYGYIQLNTLSINQICSTKRFMEKPNYETALDYLNDGNYVWNSGMFIFKYDTIMNELEKYVPNHVQTIQKLQPIIKNHTGIELSKKVKDLFNTFKRISIDYAVMEKSQIIKCIPVDIGWNDVGGFNSLPDLFQLDQESNVVKNANYFFLDSNNNIVISDKEESLITTIGVTNMVIVDSHNGILICDRSETEKIKLLLTKLSKLEIIE
ncbi:mannose-1-phosphate guanylyltransferase [Candidatus Xianfuyuplasma coldseepsis]|uniref:mannose-1-phosphate guanylyltransferase n=2 Tax=Candidatus Xianfuyuplasma coldseepsis TaxID=2782163 RepID=A0A7L7KTN4_9MOLU|nr:mannose-1-phosphate guanylyltransferase [Xianfuyuplasma coldseepsis]